MNDERKRELAEMMGEKNIVRSPIKKYSLVRLNGRTGKFVYVPLKSDGNSYGQSEEIDGISGVIVAVRRQLGEINNNNSIISTEYDDPNEIITVWDKNINSGKSIKVMTGNQDKIKEQIKTIKSYRCLYILTKNEIVRVQIKGFGLTHLFDYLNSISKEKLHLFEVKTKISSNKEESKMGEFYAVNFDMIDYKLSEEEFETVESEMKEFHSLVRDNKLIPAEVVRKDNEEIDVIDIDKEDLDEEIIEEIPF